MNLLCWYGEHYACAPQGNQNLADQHSKEIRGIGEYNRLLSLGGRRGKRQVNSAMVTQYYLCR